ncbi:Protoporphyrinogen oxidase, partial [Rhizoclosmatium globosum]
GGISGLSTAWFAAKAAPRTTLIKVIEGGTRCGGWIHSSLDSDSDVLFESGPRTLRPVGPQGLATLELVFALGLKDQVIAVPKNSPAAKNRFIKYNGNINKMPSSLQEALFPPTGHVFRGVMARGALEPFIKRTKADDESIHDFVSRRFGRHVADNMISALVHGIYAGDSRNLSVKSCFKFLWEAEQKYGSVVLGLLAEAFKKPVPDVYSHTTSPEGIEFIQKTKSASVYAFKNGLQTLTDAIIADLTKNHPNVSILQNTRATHINLTPSNTVKVTTSTNEIFESSTVISALDSLTLQTLLPKTSSLPALLSKNPSVDVAVVNLAYKPPTTLPVSGFGYLVPRTQTSDVIGVIFDSSAIPGQGSDPSLTRITCMMGGHRFKEVFASGYSNDLALEKAKKAIRDDLGIAVDPDAFKVSLHRQCITQYTVGHSKRMQEMHGLLQKEFDGKLSVVGNSWFGVGVNDCVLGARETVERILKGDKAVTGLE